jgi:hypothetical protein
VKVLVVAPGPSFSVSDVQRGWEKALTKLGHDVRTYNLDDRLPFFSGGEWPSADDDAPRMKLSGEEAVRLAVEPLGNACYRFWPEVILVVSGFFIPQDLWEVWQNRPHKTVLLCTESPYEDVRQFEQVMTGAPDCVLLNDPSNIERFRAYHKHTYYVPHAYDAEIHTPGPVDLELASDFCFVGTGYASRMDFLARVDWRGVDLKLGGMMHTAKGTCSSLTSVTTSKTASTTTRR